MEDTPKHDKNNDNHHNKTRPPTINLGVGGLGVGGIVLLGGALVATTIMSAFAFKTRSQRRRSSSDDDLMMKKNMSTSPETHNPSDTDDVITSMKEMRTKSNQSLTPDEKHDCVPSGDDNEDRIASLAVKDQESTSIHVDSVFESEEVDDDDYDKIDLDSEKQVAMAAQIELERVDGNENDEHVDANSSVSIEEHEAVEAENEDKDYQETVFMNEAVAMEDVCVNPIKVEDNLQVQFLEESEKDCNEEIVVENHLSDETDYADQLVHEVVTEEATDAASLLQIEVIKAACGNLVKMKDNLETADDEVGQEMQVNQVCETFVVECVMNRIYKEAADDQTTAKEDAPPTRLINKEEKTEENVSLGDEMLIEATIVDDQADNPPKTLMNKEEKEEEMVKEHELVKKDEIPHVQSVEEDVTVKDELSSDEVDMQEELTPAAKISNHKTEDKTIIGEKQAFASEQPWNLKLMIWAAVLISVWCLCHWYSELPFAELSLAGSLFILMLLGYKNRTTYALTSSFLSKP